MGCECRRDPAEVAEAKRYGFPIDKLKVIECASCKRQRLYEEENREEEVTERLAFNEFIHADEWDRNVMIFNFMYEKGWRP